MKKTILLMMLSALMCGCIENENQQYEKAKQSKNISLLDKYLEKNPDAPSAHIDTIIMIRQGLMEDNQLFDKILSSANAIERYELEKIYLDKFMEGLHLVEVKQMTTTDKSAAEEQIKNMSIFDLANFGLLQELSFKASGEVDISSGCKRKFRNEIILNMQTGEAELWHYGRYVWEGDPQIYADSNFTQGSWKSIYVKRGDRQIKSLEIECGKADLYTTEKLDLLYNDYFDFLAGNNRLTYKITDIKKKIVVDGKEVNL